ncbi:MAG: tRNA uridine-5-carboxymethylaminomethyl(34) synthesis GTPase MnmE [Bacteroidales bacterium]|jgi:tRNA modification GTPase|nr:tRNA uridine-5-carboxymethylaminomethyl(34) synthesis GTPase MnmE [Bacteroidales bacterium]
MNIAAISTPHGLGGIAVIRVSGPDATAIVDRHFKPHKAGHQLVGRPTHTLTFGQFTTASGEVLDDVVCSLYKAPHSFTGEDVVEISCHGSLYVQQAIMHELTSPDSHCRLAEAGEFTRRAFSNGRMDLSQAEAVADLIAAQTAAQHRVAISQLKGSISQQLDALRDQLLQLTSLLELELDFSEEDVEFADRTQLLKLANSIDQEVTHLSDSFAAGNAIKNGIPVAIIGAPNVGKSTLLNALLKDDRAIVSDIQGTTRDLIEDTITLGGFLFRFIDTAGIRHTDDTIERLGIERSMLAAEKAQIILLLTEPNVDFPTINVRDDQTVIRIVNKTPEFQALNNIGIDQLEQRLVQIAQSFVSGGASDGILITNIRHKQMLDQAHCDITLVIQGLEQHLSGDLVAEDLRAVITSLNAILGRSITSQDTLNNIFKNFCVGK